MSLTRREFITYSTTGSSLLLCIPLSQASQNPVGDKQQNNWCVYLTIKPDNQIVIESPVQDMGQHMKTTGPMIIAEELDADWSLVKCKPAKVHIIEDGDKVLYRYATMSTGGSHAVRNNWDYLRRAGAVTRQLLKQAAGVYWQVSPDSLKTQNSFVINPNTGEKVSYGHLAKTAASLQLESSDVPLKKVRDYKILGRDITTVDIDEIVTGKPLFGLDMKTKGMLHAVIARSPFYQGKISRYSDAAALKVKGVIKTIKIDLQTNKNHGGKVISEGVAVVAESLWAAMKGKAKLEIEWRQNKFQDESSEKLLEDFRKLCGMPTTDSVAINDGRVEQAFKSADRVVEQEYVTQHMAHLCMEPMNAIVEISQNAVKIIVGNQNPKGVAEAVAAELKLNTAQVEVVPTRMGGGFGRKWQTDFVIETVRIAKHFDRPVKLSWMREDEIQQDYFGQAVVAKVKAAIDIEGNISGWHNRQAQVYGAVHEYCFPQGLVPNYRVDRFFRPSGTEIGAWRGPGHLQFCFIAESMIDEIAYQLNRDALEYRMALYGDVKELEYKGYGGTSKNAERMKKCYQKVADMADWKKPRSKGVGLGIAGHFTFGSYAAFVVEYDSTIKEECKITNVWGAIDCGLPLNPNHIRNQMEGGFIDGLNAALYNNVRIKDGAVQTNNFDTLHFMRMHESPKNIDVAIIENDFPPTGVGEPPTAPAAAALANAIFAATGVRQTELPLKLI